MSPAGDVLRYIDRALQRGAVVLTPNQRTARRVAADFDGARQSENAGTWQAPDVLPWRAWAHVTWTEAIVQGAETRIVLNDLQERAIWQRVIQSSARDTLTPVASQAKLCAQAMGLLGEYDTGSLFTRQKYVPEANRPDTVTFAGWFAQFEDFCQRAECLPSSYLDLELAMLLQKNRSLVAAEYLLFGFDQFSPSQERVIAALESSGARVERIALEVARVAAPVLMRAETGRAELEACGTWLRSRLEETPLASLAVIVPDLDLTRPELERELRFAIAPHLANVTRGERKPVFEFSSGRPLSHLALVHDALLLLRWCVGELSIADAGALLRSAYVSLAVSPERGAELDLRKLRRSKVLRAAISLRQAASIVQDRETADRLHLVASAAARHDTSVQTFANCADHARELLHVAGWPGQMDVGSEEYQAVDRWNETLDRLATLDLLGRRTGFAEFVAEIQSLAAETLFAPENVGAPVQIMTIREAAGSSADALWFLHADENTWPSPRSPHPLLPWQLQRDLGMPGTNAGKDEQTDRTVLERVLKTAGEVVFSYATANAEGVQRVSTVTGRVLEQSEAKIVSASQKSDHDLFLSPLERVEDACALPSLPQGVTVGGVDVITAQAQCGFRAFAEKRLFSVGLEEVEAGQSAAERGEQVHAVLQMFWETVQTQTTLIALQNKVGSDRVSERDRLLRQCIETVLQAAPEHTWDAAYLNVQRERLFSLLCRWLDFEAGRTPFAVRTLEQSIPSVPVGPLLLKMRVDRIDQITTNEENCNLLIDYKTGAASSREWLGERPDAPQLPVYAVAGAPAAGIEQVNGIAFGMVRVTRDGMKLDGSADNPSIFGQKSNKALGTFQDQLVTWQRDLVVLANAFAEGDASVDPKEYPKTCERCAQRMLCRVDASNLLQLDDPALEDEDDEVNAWQ